MSDQNKVIDLTERRRQQLKQKSQPERSSSTALKGNGELVDMTARRQDILNEERREVRRTILTEFVGATVVIPEVGLMKVAIYDISDDGLAFDMEFDEGQFSVGEEVAMRVYLNQHTYFPFVVKIQNVREELEEGVYRHGTHFVKGTVNTQALFHFTQFIETVSASLVRDNGDVMVSKLRNHL